MKETSKAMRRRICEEVLGGFKWSEILNDKAKGVDLGSGDDPLQLAGVRPFDKEDGDAQYLSRYVGSENLDYVHASQLLEHVVDPGTALRDWLSVLKPGGHVVVTVPDFDLYEKRLFPSRWNPDHKHVFSLWRKGHPGVAVDRFITVPPFLASLPCRVLLCRLVDTNFDWSKPELLDQTLPEDGAECFIEFVLRK